MTPMKLTASSASQYQRLSLTPDNTITPVVINTGKAATPINGLEIPKKSASLELITVPQFRTGLRLQIGK